MASLVRITFGALSSKGSPSLLTPKNIKIVRTITSHLEDLPEKPKPYPYQEKSYNILKYPFDKTVSRLDENSKLIVVEGPIASGKTKLAKEIAKAFNMLYLPEANLSMYYINEYGFDLRTLDPQVPDSCKTFDIPNFLRNPTHGLAARMQIFTYSLKYSQYIDALAHLLSTGQGVVLDRCAYSDFVFAEAMYSQKFLSKAAYKKYYEFRDCTIQELLRPHLILYLDVPTPKVLENVAKRGYACEKNSQALTPQYLQVMEKHYKQNYLKEMSRHAELLVYDWSEEGDVEIVVEDIERIDFNKYDAQDTQLKDWVHYANEDWNALRNKYADRKSHLLNYLHIPALEVPELVVEAEDADLYHSIVNQAPGHEYEVGYNTVLGDTGILFKTSLPHRETLPLIERKLN